MFYTYIIQSDIDQTLYIGLTNNIQQRLERHNAGSEEYTSKKRPWQILFYAAFRTRLEAAQFEKYLKSGSGREFIRKRIQLSSNLSAEVVTQ